MGLFITGGRKIVTRLSKEDFKGMRALQAEKAMKSHIIVCLEPSPREVDGIKIMPIDDFLRTLWRGELS
jgi:hypothetical protein